MLKPYFETENGVLYHGDCLEIMPQLEPVDLVLTDPPYLLPGMKGAGCFGGRKSLENTKNFTDTGFNVDLLDNFKNWFCFCSKHNLVDIINKTNKRWALLHWCKTNPVPTCNNTYLSDVEYCVHSWEEGRLFGKMKDKSLFFLSPCGNKKTEHPNEKPIGLIIKLLTLGSTIGETILDPFAGSGTTPTACEMVGRKWIAIEQEEKWCEVSAKRTEQENRQLKLC